MAVMVDSRIKDTWRDKTPPEMSSFEEDCSEYSFAEVYTGPRPAYVPKAELIGSFPLSSDVFSSTHQSCASPSPARVVVESSIVCKSYDGFVNETSEELPSGTSIPFPSVVADPFPNPSQIEASKESMDPAHADLHVSNARNISLDMFTSCRLESGYLEQDDGNTTPRSEFSGRQSFSSSSSTNSRSEELQDQTLPDPSSPPNASERKKGECFKCTKVNRMQEKEKCLVCCARYCGSCVLEIMGSMPEGRKCVLCIGKPICELWRQHLGKPTRLLKRLLSTLEVQQIMETEKKCSVNQLRPSQICVNGQPLTVKEFAELLRCKNPPSKLKPGSYWYDAQCGYWGKVGEKPEEIISVHLRVGGDLREDASAGYTRVYINNREITKLELMMLKFADVLCPPQTRLMLHHDGSYQEEVQNHCPGKLWDKAKVRYFCYLFSLPTLNFHGVVAPEPSRAVPAYLDSTLTHKILLLGHSGCGTSTIIKQAKFLYGEGFTLKERQDIKVTIQRNIYKYIVMLLEARERFEDEENVRKREVMENTPSTSESDGVIKELEKNVYTMTARLKDQADWFLQTDASGELEKYHPALTREDASLLEELWKNRAIQATYKRKAEIHMLPDVAGDFLSRVVDISADNYLPSDHDILCAEGGTQDSLITEIQFSIEEDGSASGAYNEDYDESLAEARYHLIQISSGAIADGGKFLKMFDDVQALVFCVALDSYDQMWSDGKSPLQNRMLVSRNMFESILTRPNFKDKPMLLFFNKFDLFQEKLLDVPLTACEWFSAYNPVKSSKPVPKAMAEQAYTYIAHMFKKHVEMINPNGGRLYTFQLQALEIISVKDGFQLLKEVLRWEESRNRIVPVTSVYTTETSSLVIGPPHRG